MHTSSRLKYENNAVQVRSLKYTNFETYNPYIRSDKLWASKSETCSSYWGKNCFKKPQENDISAL